MSEKYTPRRVVRIAVGSQCWVIPPGGDMQAIPGIVQDFSDEVAPGDRYYNIRLLEKIRHKCPHGHTHHLNDAMIVLPQEFVYEWDDKEGVAERFEYMRRKVEVELIRNENEFRRKAGMVELHVPPEPKE